MDVHVQHDPRTKQQIKDALYMHLYEPVQRSFKSRLDSLILKNTLLIKASHKSFNYKGVSYSCDTSAPPRKANRLAPELRAEMDMYLQDLKDLDDNERPFVVGFINQVLNSSNDFCDYLELLPSSVHRAIQQFEAIYPCRSKHLSAVAIQAIQERNAKSIALMRERMAANLLIF